MKKEMSDLQQQNKRKVLIEQDKLNRQTPFDTKQQFYPADLFILKGFDFKNQPVWERNPRWHIEDGFYIERPEKDERASIS
jgi:hypothetical protein